ncbi:MAG: peptidylprolyl isomerase [Gammaproteobacteria bacterium]|nr:peptidylprolyl isomerase [Gammaproteobacteria bacterium]MDE2261663.1 peptidylprolyl isomerase [Gammaproteobacteria bacterium]
MGALVSPLAFQGLALAQTRDLSTQGAPLDRIAAVVNNGVVLESEVDDQMKEVTTRLQAQNMTLPPESVLRKQVLDRLILQRIELEQANRDGITISDDTLNSALEDVAKRNNIAFSDLPTVLSQQGIDYASYREQMRQQLTIGLLRQRDVLQRIVVTPREIDQFLAKQADHPATNEEYNVSHILIAVPPNATPAQIVQAQQRANDVYQRASKGEDFGKLAVAYSNSEDALEGGSLGWRQGSELPTFLTSLILGLKPGQVGAPLRTPTGFHIVRLNQVRTQDKKDIVEQIHVRHILLKTNALQDDATVRQRLEQIRQSILKGESFAVAASAASQDPGSASDGGDLGWQSPDVFDPTFSAAVEKLKVGEISEPFKTRYGWHIAQLLGRRSHDDTQEVKRLNAMEAIRASKADEDTELWLQHLRDDAYVKVMTG